MSMEALKLQHEDNILSRFSIFQDFQQKPEVLKEVLSYLKPKNFQQGSTIIQEGENGSELYFLIKGRVVVLKSTPSGDQFKVVELNDHMNVLFGEGAIVDDDNRSATIRAITDVECLVLDRLHFDDLSKNHPEIALPVFQRIARLVMGRLRKTSQDFMLLYNALVEEIRGETQK